MSPRQLGRAAAYSRLLALFRRLLKQRPHRPGRRPPRHVRAGSEELRALIRQQLTVDEYLEAKMVRSLEPLRAFLLEAEIAHVHACLREHVRTQPMWRRVVRDLRDLLQRAERQGGSP
jgi:hypothetical protein